MFYEKLALEVNAGAAGLQVVRPAVVRGESGIDQRFTMLATGDGVSYAFDIVQQATEEQVLRTFVKQLDTKVTAFIVSLNGRPSQKAKELADGYGIGIITPVEVGDFFSKKLVPQAVSAGGLKERILA